MAEWIAESRATTSCSDGLAKRVAIWICALVALCGLPNGVGATPPAAVPPDVEPQAATEPEPVPQVVIEAQRQALEHRLFHFVTTITKQVGSYESLARWHHKVCPLVAGLPQDRGEFVLSRISTIAASAGAPLGPSDCKANLFVFFTADPTKLLRTLVSRDAGRFVALSGQRADAAAIKRFTESTRPIRAWYNAELKGASGNSLRPSDDVTMGGRQPLENDHALGSRIHMDDVQDITSVLIVVDTHRTGGLSIGAVADYVAILGLAEINPDANVTGNDSVLRLFIAPDGARTLSQLGTWDAAFLKALYGTEQANNMQLHLIVDSMMRDASVAPQPK
jgi:hypothetical protein